MLNFQDFQFDVDDWLCACLGESTAKNKVERNYRFLEEALELVQALGCSKDDALKLVDYVYGRPLGEPKQEVGGVMVTLAALCTAHAMNMSDLGYKALDSAWARIDTIRAKDATKPLNSPLPGVAPTVGG